MTENKSQGQGVLSTTFVWMAVAFCVCLVASNIFVPRLWQVGNLPIQLTGGVLIFPISYILNDCLAEVYGFRKAQLVIWMGFAMSFFVAVMSQLVTMLPAPMFEDSYEAAESFNRLFGMVPRVMFASLLAFICGSTLNALVVSRMKVAQNGRRFGVRAIVSTIAGELADSLIFFPIVFAGRLPLTAILSLMVTQVIVKTLYEVIILPVTTFCVRKLKSFEGVDTFDEGISYNPFMVFKKIQ